MLHHKFHCPYHFPRGWNYRQAEQFSILSYYTVVDPFSVLRFVSGANNASTDFLGPFNDERTLSLIVRATGSDIQLNFGQGTQALNTQSATRQPLHIAVLSSEYSHRTERELALALAAGQPRPRGE